MSIVSQGASAVLSVQFYDPATNVPMDPSSIQFQLLYEDSATPATPPIIIGPLMLGALTRTGVGAYEYIWNVPTNITLGNYQAQWVAVVNGVPQFNFDEIVVMAPSTDDQAADSGIVLSTDSHIEVGIDHISFKFDITPKALSVYNGSYQLFRVNASSDVLVQDPFLAIQATNYNSISRVLTLYFSAQLTPNAQYALYVSGIYDVAGLLAPDRRYLFAVPAGVAPSITPIETPIYVEDHSIAETPFTSLNIIQELDPHFYITGTDPSSTDIFVDPTYNNGQITIQFSTAPALTYLNNNYFKVQYKPLSRGFNRWVEVANTQITADPVLPYIYIRMPSLDATPVYNQTGSQYYQSNYKYRIRISSAVCATSSPPYDNLVEDQYVGFLVNPAPFFIDPDTIQPYFPEASCYEIAELIYDASQEAQDFFDDGIYTQTITPTIQSALQDFVIADVCCKLTRIYEYGGSSNQIQMTLGDLSVNQNNPAKSEVNRSNATTWCELAGITRYELYNLSIKSGMKAVVKGSKYWNPMPRRRIEHQEWRSWGWDRDSDWREDWN